MADDDKTVAVFAPVRAGGGVLRRMLVLAIDGGAGLPGARASAAKALQDKGEHESAIDAVVRLHVAMAGAQGFVTSLGGLVTLAVTLPANMAGLSLLQLRMVAAIAHLRGYDVDDPRVRSAIMLTLLGDGVADLPAPLTVATAPVFDEALDHTISERVLAEMAKSVGGRRAMTLVGRRIPLVGGGIGAVSDSWDSHVIARWAETVFVTRRVVH